MSKTVLYIVGALVTTGATVGSIALYKHLRAPSPSACGCGPTCGCGPCKEKHGQSHEEERS